MQPLAQGAYSDAQVRAALHGPRTVAWRYDLLDSDGTTVLGALSTVQAAEVQHQALADVPRTLRLSLGAEQAVINYGRHRVRPWWQLRMPDGGWVEWPQGVFLLSTPTRDAREGASSRQVEGYDQTVLLRDDLVPARVSIAAGANVVAQAVAQVQAAGVTQVSAEPSTAVLPTALEWEPGTPRYVIVADLLQAVNYAGLWFDGMGRAVLRPYRNPAEVGAGYRYADDSASVVAPQATDTLDLYAVPNRWIAVVSEPERAPLVSTYTNTLAASPTSTVSRGRTVAVLLTGVQAVDQATLDAYVLRVARDASQVYRKVRLSTAAMPHHEHLDVLDLAVSSLGVTGLFTETGWTLSSEVGGSMGHDVRLLVSV